MSTIAYKDGVLAADTACICNGVYEGRISKTERCLDGTIVAVTGDAAALAPFRDWISSGSKKDERPNVEDFSGLVVRPGGSVRNYDTHFVPLDITADFYAIGSGRDIALGAMAAGASAKEAVEIACRYDVGSRAPVEVYEAAPLGADSKVVAIKGRA